eukprot:CAMPEP_0176314860 /NCGR_PEP_ID=MMETSP0121_2-20121125/67901_1 /TAXON_ID=160619 /ORGANISM="Kryptoperidinium foliaceum, Strain CCMP 1326" /LENGTH=129 /DNA_ID=CAMNT_0017656985 /DNA_START=68 /DNA_END=453 /DNA_ORIENTATION=+
MKNVCHAASECTCKTHGQSVQIANPDNIAAKAPSCTELLSGSAPRAACNATDNARQAVRMEKRGAKHCARRTRFNAKLSQTCASTSGLKRAPRPPHQALRTALHRAQPSRRSPARSAGNALRSSAVDQA